MEKYEVEVEGRYTAVIEVEADSPEEADKYPATQEAFSMFIDEMRQGSM